MKLLKISLTEFLSFCYYLMLVIFVFSVIQFCGFDLPVAANILWQLPCADFQQALQSSPLLAESPENKPGGRKNLTLSFLHSQSETIVSHVLSSCSASSCCELPSFLLALSLLTMSTQGPSQLFYLFPEKTD